MSTLPKIGKPRRVRTLEALRRIVRASDLLREPSQPHPAQEAEPVKIEFNPALLDETL